MARRKIRSRSRLVNAMAAIMRKDVQTGEAATVFRHEGLFIHLLRGRLCLVGWPWIMADVVARQLVAEALDRIEAERPTWYEGQPEYVIQPGVLIARTRCVRCHKKLPEGHHKFCGELCGNAHRLRIMRLQEARDKVLSSI